MTTQPKNPKTGLPWGIKPYHSTEELLLEYQMVYPEPPFQLRLALYERGVSVRAAELVKRGEASVR